MLKKEKKNIIMELLIRKKRKIIMETGTLGGGVARAVEEAKS